MGVGIFTASGKWLRNPKLEGGSGDGCAEESLGSPLVPFQGPRMKDKELGDRILEGLIPRVSGMVPGRVLALLFVTVEPALESLKKLVKDTESLVPLSFPNQGPGVKAQGLCGITRVSRWFWEPSTNHSGPGWFVVRALAWRSRNACPLVLYVTCAQKP